MQGARIVAVALVAALASSGCGYKFVRHGGDLGGVRDVSISTLRNDSYEPGIEFVVADALRREFLRRGVVALTDDAPAADLVLDGRVLPIETRALSFSSVVFALEYEVVVALELTARRRDGTRIPIDPRALRETERYLASADVEATRKNREEALRRLAGVLAARVHDVLALGLEP